MNFEEKCDRLQEIVKSLEKGEVGLKDATKLFEEGPCSKAKILSNWWYRHA